MNTPGAASQPASRGAWQPSRHTQDAPTSGLFAGDSPGFRFLCCTFEFGNARRDFFAFAERTRPGPPPHVRIRGVSS